MVDYAAARKAMVDGQIRPSDVTYYPILKALLNVPRESYVPREMRAVAYMDQPIDLGEGREILAPRTLGRMLEAINIQPNELVLVIGAEFGYATAIIAQLAEAVVAVEENATMVETATATLAEQSVDNAMVVNAPLSEGAAKPGPYDSIVVLGAVETLPVSIASQLKTGGKIVAIHHDDKHQQISVAVKSDSGLNWNAAYNASALTLPGFEFVKEFEF